MSAIPLKADVRATSRHVRLVPASDIKALFDDLVGGGEQQGRHNDA